MEKEVEEEKNVEKKFTMSAAVPRKHCGARL
jgi:hypothetical protein